MNVDFVVFLLFKAITTTVLNSILWSINSFSIDGYHEFMDSVRLSDLCERRVFPRWRNVQLTAQKTQVLPAKKTSAFETT